MLAWALDAGVRFISLFWGNPAEHVAAIDRAGALVAATAGSGEEARQQVAAGVDVVIAQGWEAGGHVWGRVATLPLVPAVVDAVTPSPVVAAGGIADGRGLAAVLALGARRLARQRSVMSEEAWGIARLPRAPRRRDRDRHGLLKAVRRRLAGRTASDASQQAHR